MNTKEIKVGTMLKFMCNTGRVEYKIVEQIKVFQNNRTRYSVTFDYTRPAHYSVWKYEIIEYYNKEEYPEYFL